MSGFPSTLRWVLVFPSSGIGSRQRIGSGRRGRIVSAVLSGGASLQTGPGHDSVTALFEAVRGRPQDGLRNTHTRSLRVDPSRQDSTLGGRQHADCCDAALRLRHFHGSARLETRWTRLGLCLRLVPREHRVKLFAYRIFDWQNGVFLEQRHTTYGNRGQK